MLDETDPNLTLFFLVDKKTTLRHRAIQINRDCVYRDPSFPILVEIYPDEYHIYRIKSLIVGMLRITFSKAVRWDY